MNPVKILIVEDDSNIAEQLAHTLSDKGYLITGIAESAETALALQEKNSADLLLVDVHLKGSQNGVELVQELMNQRPFHLIFITSDQSDQTFTQMLGAMPHDVLEKPVSEFRLMRAIKRVLQQPLMPQQVPEVVFIPDGSKFIRLETKTLLYLRADGSSTEVYSLVHGDIRKTVISLSSNHVHEQLKNPRIFQVHRSYYIHQDWVDTIESRHVYIKGHMIPVSNSHRGQVKQTFHFLGRGEKGSEA